MADQLYLSYWVRGFTEHNMLRHFEKLLGKFPFSTMSPAGPVLRVYALEFVEPPLLERRFDWDADIGTVIAAAKEFQNADCGYLLEAYWDLWQYTNSWKLTPSAVRLACFGTAFENDLGDHLRIECGLDADFLPRPHIPESAGKTQSNVRSLLRLAHELDDLLPLGKRLLQTESGENFADRLKAAMENVG